MKAYALFQEYIWLVNTIHRFGRLTLEEIKQRWVRTEMSEGLLSESRSVHERIVLEPIPSDGEHLHMFIEAMKMGVRVLVNYRRYGAEASKSAMKLDPCFVKLFNKRWYALVKYPMPEANLFTLAFDRIVSLELTEEKATYDKDFDPSAWFRDCYGIVRDPEVPVEKVVLRAFGREVFYLRDLPFHHSQKEVATADGYSDFELTLRPTEDFLSPLLARGPAIQVLEPQWFAEMVRDQHLAALERYK